MLLFFSGNIFSQKNNTYTVEEEVNANITTLNINDNEIRITYSINEGDHPNTPFTISFFAKVEDEPLKEYKLGLSGNIGSDVLPGKDKNIKWNYTEDLVPAQVENLVKSNIKLIGKRTVTKKIVIPSVVVPSVISVVGAGALGFGLLQELSANDDYDFYKENNILTDEYTATERDQYLSDAQDKRQLGTIAMAAGGVGLGVGLFLLKKKLDKRKEAKEEMKKHGLSFQPDIRFFDKDNSSIGMKFVYKF